MSNVVQDYGSQYETVAVSQTDQVIGSTGEKGDYLTRIIIQVATASTGSVTVKDGGTTIFTFTASPGGGIGSYSVPFGVKSVNGPFKITTGAGAQVLAVGHFI